MEVLMENLFIFIHVSNFIFENDLVIQASYTT